MEARLDAVTRETKGKNEARRLRVAGRIPANLYGGVKGADGKPQATSIAVDPKALMGILRSESGVNTLIKLTVGDEDVKVLMREYQIDPVSSKLLHADFFRIAMDKMLTVTVQITVKGEAKGIKQQGGLLDFVHREVEIECLPADIPEHIEIDVSELMLNQSLRLRDIIGSMKWKPVSEADLMLVHVVAPKAEAEPVAAEADVAVAPAEPEVIKKGKTEKEGEGEAEPKKK